MESQNKSKGSMGGTMVYQVPYQIEAAINRGNFNRSKWGTYNGTGLATEGDEL